MPTFIVDNPGFKNPTKLSSDDEHHLIKVLRVAVGEKIDLTDNQGKVATATISSLSPLEFSLSNIKDGPRVSPLTVYMPLIDKDRLEWSLEKLTELNIETVQLVITDRTQKKDISEKNFQRLVKISESAQKQCGRSTPLKIINPIKLRDVKITKQAFYGAFTPSGDESFEQSPSQLFVGPEGGFTQNEIDYLIENNVKGLKFGNTVLRAETAALSLTGLINHFYEGSWPKKS